jgi:hypothetical protein
MMDEALAWVQLIPPDRYVLRRIVNARALVNPSTQRHLYGWSAIARLIGADARAVKRWHAQGIAYIAHALSEKSSARTRNHLQNRGQCEPHSRYQAGVA